MRLAWQQRRRGPPFIPCRPDGRPPSSPPSPPTSRFAAPGRPTGGVFGRVAGVLVAFLVPFLDLGIAQDPMLYPSPPTWAHILPGYGGFRILTSAILTGSFSQARPLLIALTWLAAATAAAAAVVFRRNLRTAGRVTAGRPPQP